MTNNLFDANFYRTANPDLASLNDAQLSEHFMNFGLNEGRSFSPFVDLKFYGDRNPDLAAAGLTTNKQLYEHLQNFGVAEGRQFSPVVDLGLYLTKNPDLNAAFAGNRERAFEHLQTFGIPEGRQFSLVFDLNAYRQANPDLVTAGLNNQQLLQHFARFGMEEGRLASPFFNARYYLQRHPDLVSAGLNFRQAFQHFVSSGLNENRSPFPGFSEAGYLEFNPDVRQAVEQGQLKSGFEHYVNFGASENRVLRIFRNPNPEGTRFVGGEVISFENTGFDNFGQPMVTIGNNVLIAAPRDDAGAFDAGVAYLFDGTSGALLHTFTNPAPTPENMDFSGDFFASSVAAVGNNILIGSPSDDTGAPNAGAAYLYDGITGNLLRTFTNPTPEEYDYFGDSVAAVGNNILITASGDNTGAFDVGAAYLFDGITGNLLRTFTNPTPATDDRFGDSVAAVGNKILIAAPNDDTGGFDAGSAYLYDSTTGALLRTFTNPTPEADDYFGDSVAAVGNNILIGAPDGYDRNIQPGRGAGAVYLFDSITGDLLRTFTKPNPETNDRFGAENSVAAVGNNVLVAAPTVGNYLLSGFSAAFPAPDVLSPGSAYLFDSTTGALLQNFPNPRPEIGDLFGNSVAALGNHALINAPNERAGNLVAGAVYLF